MTLREIIVDEVWWVVFAAGPPTGADGSARWLWAHSLSERRPLAPLPPDWEAWPDARLASQVRHAVPHPPIPLP